MPRTNRVFPYVDNAYYHIYLRGVNKGAIFRDDKDYWVFRNIVRRKTKEMGGEAKTDTFSLLDNHLHLRYFQKSARMITTFMRSIMVRYALYIRKKYDLHGQQFEGSFRGVYLPTKIEQDRVRDYILKNPIRAGLIAWPHVGTKI